ncbi:transposase [Xanthocytophaga flavus]
MPCPYKNTHFTESQIIKIIQEAEGGRAVPDICREYAIDDSAYYN